MRHSNILTRRLIGLYIVSIAYNLGTTVLLNGLPLYLDGLGRLATASGALVAAYCAAGVIARVYGGWICGRFGNGRVMLAAFCLFGVLSFLTGLTASFGVLLILRIVSGMSYSLGNTSATASCVELTPSGKTNESLGYLYFGQSVCLGVGASFIVLLTRGDSFMPMFVLSAAIFLLAGVLGYISNPGATKASATHNSPKLDDMLDRAVIPIAIASFLLCVGLSSVISFALLYASNRGIVGGNLFFLVAGIALVASNILFPKISDKVNPKFVLVPSLLVGAAGFCVLAYAGGIICLLIAGFCFGIVMGACMPILNGIAVGKVDASRQRAAVSTFLISSDLGSGFGSLLWGRCIDALGFRFVYLGAAACTIAALSVYFIVSGKKNQRSVP
jgi:predicted MFS family arabinose efflux permease